MTLRRKRASEDVAPETPRLGVVLIDALPTTCAGLRLLIETQKDMEVLTEATTSDEAITAIKGLRHQTGVLVLLGMNLIGPHDSYWLIRTLRERFPTLALIGCGANADKTSISRAFFVGTDGFVDKNADPDEFLDALRRAAAGDVVLVGPPGDWIGSITEGIGQQREAVSVLTEREQEVLSIAAEGITAKEIGRRLGVSERTITTHLHRIYSKLGVKGRVAALQAASRSERVAVPDDQ